MNSSVAHHELKVLILLQKLVHVNKVLNLTERFNEVDLSQKAGIFKRSQTRRMVDASDASAEIGRNAFFEGQKGQSIQENGRAFRAANETRYVGAGHRVVGL